MPLKFPFILGAETSSVKRPFHLSASPLFKWLNFNANLITHWIRAGRCCADPQFCAPTCQCWPETPLASSPGHEQKSRQAGTSGAADWAQPQNKRVGWGDTQTQTTPIPKGRHPLFTSYLKLDFNLRVNPWHHLHTREHCLLRGELAAFNDV